MADHPEALRRRSLAAAPGSPWITYYDGPTGGRVELSAATLDNWVAKAAGLLSEEFDVGEGSTVVIDLDPHWLLHVWTWATWALGATVGLPDAADSADLAVVVADRSGSYLDIGAVPVLACSGDPMARPLGARTPPGATDVMIDIASYPDFLSLPMPAAGALAVRSASESLRGDEATRRARALLPHEGSTLLVTSAPAGITGFLAATLSAAAVSARTILVHPMVDDVAQAKIIGQEQVDVTLGNL